MNSKIAKIISRYIEPLNWIDKLSGLTQIAQVKEGDKVKRFPISCETAYDDCKQGCYSDLMPNSKYGSVVFFEDLGFKLTGKEASKLSYESRLRLIAWLNYKKISGGCGASGDYVISIIRALPALKINIDDMIGVGFTVESQLPRSSAIFGKYTFNERAAQYLMLPYDYFALDLKVTFTLIGDCIISSPQEGCLEC